MKLIKKLILVLLIIIFPNKLYALSYTKAIDVVNDYILKEPVYKKNYHNYLIITDNKYYPYSTDIENFRNGGFLNYNELLITVTNNNVSNSYLYDGTVYWTYSDGNIKDNKYIVSNYLNDETNISNDIPGVKITQYVKNDVRVTGSGTKMDPWVFVNMNTIIYDNQGGSEEPKKRIAVYGEKMPEITLPEKKHYLFDGYYTSKDGSGIQYYNKKGDSIKNWDLDYDIILYAKWTERPKYFEPLLNGTDPVLAGDLIPVTIEKDGTVKYADVYEKWYSYDEKQWANAVILSNGNYSVGDVIPEESIESYFVWIPRYKYKLWNVNNTFFDSIVHTNYKNIKDSTREIEIIFENKDTNISNGKDNGEWHSHPAFQAFNSNGFWSGKFETGYKGATSKNSAQINKTDTSKVLIKPNVYSWRNSTVNNMFKTSYNYKRNLESHMMKNTEWGAVAYLTNSKYGKNDNVRINNNSSYLTGYSKTEQPTCGWPSSNESCNRFEETKVGKNGIYTKMYNTEIGYLASTTGNISGIYDMSGGTHEYVAAFLEGYIGSSGFKPSSYQSKYYDLYKGSSYSDRILGDATGEMGPFTKLKTVGSHTTNIADVSGWYATSAYFVFPSSPWFSRSGNNSDGVLCGPFHTDAAQGGAYSHLGFRIVLTP